MNEKLSLEDKTHEISETKNQKRASSSVGRKSNKRMKSAENIKNVDVKRYKELKPQYLHIMRVYFEGHINLEAFKNGLQNFRQKEKDLEFFLAFRWEKFSGFAQDAAFHWFLDELDKDIEDFTTYKFRGKNNTLIALIKSICYNEKLLEQVFKRTKIKEVILHNYAPQLILLLLNRHDELNIPLFLDQYFGSIKEALKNEIVLQEKTQQTEGLKLLDLLLYSKTIKYILPLWDEGFRPYSQLEFNKNLFSLEKSWSRFRIENPSITLENEIKETYKAFGDNENYKVFFSFSETIDPLYLFLTNKYINLPLFIKLQQKSEKNIINTELVKKVVSYYSYFSSQSDNDITNIIEKLNFILSHSEPLDIPSSPHFDSKTSLSFFPLSSNHDESIYRFCFGKVSNISLIRPQPLLGHEVLYVIARNLFSISGDYSKTIKQIYDILKEKKIDRFEMLKTLFYTYFMSATNIKNGNGYESLFMEIYNELAQKKELKNLLDSYLTVFNDICNGFCKQKNLGNKNLLEANTIADSILDFMETSFHPILISNKFFRSGFLFAQLNAQIANLLFIKIRAKYTVDKSPTLSIEKSIMDCVGEFCVKSKTSSHLFMHLIMIKILQHSINLEQTPHLLQFKEFLDLHLFSDDNALKVIKGGALCALLQNLLLKLDLKDMEQLQRNGDLIFYLFEKMNDKNLPLNDSFLEVVAKLQLNFQRKSRLSEKGQEFLNNIYDRCIHKVQNTAQQKTFEDLCTQELIKTGTDPSKDPQAIHTQENHEYADHIYQEWLQALGNDLDNKLQQGFQQFQQFMDGEKQKEITTLTSSMTNSALVEFICYQNNVLKNSLSSETQNLVDKIEAYSQTNTYINSIKLKLQKPIQVPIQPLNQNIESARKLFNLICMIGYYSKIQPMRFIQDGSEALNILKLELFDQVANPSCDQGPFIRFIMALEPVATQIRFPWVQRRNINFLLNSFINNYYHQLTIAEKQRFISDIYEKIAERETLDEMDGVPAKALTAVGKLFIEANKERLGALGENAILDFFNYDRPREYHPEIVRDLQQHHVETKNKKAEVSLNSYGFFAHNINSPTSEDIDIDALLNDSVENEFNTL